MVSNSAICGTLYGLYVYNAVIAAIAVVGVFVSMISMPGDVPVLAKVLGTLLALIAIGVPLLNALFTYMLCDRALITPEGVATAAVKRPLY